MNLSEFAKANNSKKTTTTAKDKKPRVETKNPGFFNSVRELSELNERMSADKARADMLSEEIKTISKEEWISLYKSANKNPNTIMVSQEEGDKTAQVMFVPSDKYISINEERANELKEEYGDGIIEEQTTLSFDNELLEKYGEVLLNLILSSNSIADGDKSKLIVANTKYSIRKGVIDELPNYGEVEEVMEQVRPVLSLKNVSVI
jgi:hypothetical protein